MTAEEEKEARANALFLASSEACACRDMLREIMRDIDNGKEPDDWPVASRFDKGRRMTLKLARSKIEPIAWRLNKLCNSIDAIDREPISELEDID